jgi:hypothetical protein
MQFWMRSLRALIGGALVMGAVIRHRRGEPRAERDRFARGCDPVRGTSGTLSGRRTSGRLTCAASSQAFEVCSAPQQRLAIFGMVAAILIELSRVGERAS